MRATKFACVVLLLLLMVVLLSFVAACGGGTTTTTAAQATTTSAAATPTTAAPADTTTSAAAPATTATSAAAGPAKTYTIGLIHSMSGVMAASFNAVTEAMPLVEELLNKHGGFTVNGQQYNIKLVVEDDMSTTDGAIAAAKKLIGEGVKQIVAPQFIPNNTAIASVCEQNKILRVVSIGPNLKEYSKGVANYSFAAISTAVGAQATLDKTFELYPNIKKIAIVALDDPGIQDIVGRAKADFTKRGMEITLDEQFPADVQDFYPLITKALATKPDAIAGVAGAPPYAKGLLESMRQMNFTGPLLTSAGWGDPVQLTKLIDPKYDTDFPMQQPDVTSDQMVPMVKELKALSDSKGMTMQMDYTLLLGAVWTIIQGIEKAQSFDNDAIVAAMETMDFDTIYGPGKMVGAEDIAGVNIGQNRIMATPIPFSRIMNGKVEFEWLPAPVVGK